MRFSATIAFLGLLHVPLTGEPPATHRLVLVSASGRVAERSIQMLARQLHRVEILRKSEATVYAENPQLPQAACDRETRFYLFDQVGALTSFGCLSEAQPGVAVELMRQRLQNKDWLDAALALAAAGRYAEARTLVVLNGKRGIAAGRRAELERLSGALSRLN